VICDIGKIQKRESKEDFAVVYDAKEIIKNNICGKVTYKFKLVTSLGTGLP